MPRNLEAGFKRDVLDPESGIFIPVFLVLSHPTLIDDIRIVSDVVDYIWNGNRFIGFPFQISLLTDDERPPRGQVEVQNVDRRISSWLLKLPSSPRVAIYVLDDTDFGPKDVTESARLPIGSPAIQYEASHLRLNGVSVTTATVTAELVGYDYTTEVYPGVRSTRNRLPALFR